jgi:ABC-type multidrug transport system ATPase subunit
MTPAVIEAGDLTKAAPKVVALDGMDLWLQEHSICRFLGPNGAGNAAAMELRQGLVQPAVGSARALGIDAVGNSQEAWSGNRHRPGASVRAPVSG